MLYFDKCESRFSEELDSLLALFLREVQALSEDGWMPNGNKDGVIMRSKPVC